MAKKQALYMPWRHSLLGTTTIDQDTGKQEIFAVIYLKFKQRGQAFGYFVEMMQME